MRHPARHLLKSGIRSLRKPLSALVLVLLLTSVLLPAAMIPSAASESAPVSGAALSLSCDGASALEISGRSFSPLSPEDAVIRAVVTVSDSSSGYSRILLNGKEIADLKDGENRIEIPVRDLVRGDNRLGIRLGCGDRTYTDTVVYGRVNLDDILVESVRFEQASFTRPSRAELWMPVEGASGKTVRTDPYTDRLALGDGWFDSTGLGGNTPDVPVAADFLFPYPDLTGMFLIDTTELPDGETEFVFRGKDGTVLETRTYFVDNTGPEVTFSHPSGAVLGRMDSLTCEVTDNSGKAIHTKFVDGEKVSRVRLDKLPAGGHSFSVEAEDKSGNKTRTTMLFTVAERAYGWNGESGSLALPEDAAAYEAKLLRTVRMYGNSYGTWDKNRLRTDDEVLLPIDEYPVTRSADGSDPYQSFLVKVDDPDAKEVLISYTGVTGNGVPILLRAWNPSSGCWDDLGKTDSGVPFACTLSAGTYVKDGKVRVSAFASPVGNGSNTILWDTDTQYYTSFDDLLPYYKRINEYAVSEFKNGNLAYVLHTGDLVDHTELGAEEAEREFRMADEAQDILDENGVPNGVVSGNHDVRHSEGDYTYYKSWFGADRYRGFEWYGGELNDNTHHFDLVSVGQYDFLFLFIGCYKETEEDFLSWADAVCKAYPNRNVILCTHEYILPSGAYSGKRAETIWNRVAVPNENVKMILCGHNDGVCDQWHEVEGTDRKVLEILADYQFAETGEGPQHIINNCTCDGEGYVRFMTFTDEGQLVSKTYSPIAADYGLDSYDFFPPYLDSFTYDLDLIPADRTIQTTDFQAAVPVPERTLELNSDGIPVSGNEKEAWYGLLSDGTVTKLIVRTPYAREYDVPEPEKTPEKKTSSDGRTTFSGRKRLDPAIRSGSGNRSELSYVRVGADLIPERAENLRLTSGSPDYKAEKTDEGAIMISHGGSSANWVSLTHTVSKEFDISAFPRLYFSVTTEKTAKWNLVVQVQNRDYSFSRNESLAAKFGYIYALPSDICGSWSGYIDFSEYASGVGRVQSVTFVAASADTEFSFDYLFFGQSDGGMMTFRMSDGEALTLEAAGGSSVTPPEAPQFPGKRFLGWFDRPEGEAGTKETGFTVSAGQEKTLYAVYETVPSPEPRQFQYLDEEAEIIEKASVPVWVWIAAGAAVLCIGIVVAVLLLRKKKPAAAD